MSHTYFEYTQIGSIHKCVMFDVSRLAMKAYFDLMHDILANLPEAEPYLAIFDIAEAGFPALSSSVRQGASILTTYGRQREIRILILHTNNVYANLTRALLFSFPFIKVHFARPEQEAEARLWLQGEEAPNA